MSGPALSLPGPGPEAGEQPPGLYVHIPFCKSKCAYCSFTSYPCAQRAPEEYLEALLRRADAMADHPWARARTFATLYIGGGTPTIYGGRLLAKLLTTVLGRFRFVARPEITVETNPNTASAATLAALRRAGANRLSIGVQSFSDKVLRAIGRTHTAAEAIQAVGMARQAGFANLNLDLIYGLPEQTIVDWRASLEQALSLAPEHLALYELMVEEGTLFAARAQSGTLKLPDQDAVADMEEAAGHLLAAQGYSRYEISNYSLLGRESEHNVNYWQNGSYLGLGAGAVSCFSGVRIRNVADPDQYARLAGEGREPFLDAECLSRPARFRETVIMGLRMLAGVSLASLKERFGMTPQEYYGTTMDDLLERGLVAISDKRLRLTAQGLPVANQALARLV